MKLLDALRRATHSPAPLLEAGDRVLVAVSGGPDSLSLLHALHTIQGELGLAELYAAHFHHGLRGDDADADAAFVQSFCAERNIPYTVGHGDAHAWAKTINVSVQQAARNIRYAFFWRTAEDLGATKIATAHTQDDQTETVLMNILRGTGLDGLQGIPSRREIYVRPMLNVTRAEIDAYCAAHGLTPREDVSNRDTSHYTRNRVRHELLPLLEQEYAPGVRDALLRLSEIAGADADYLTAQARAALPNVTLEQDTFFHTLSVPHLAMLHPALLRAVLRLALFDLRGSREGLTFAHVERLCDAIRTPPPTPFGLTMPYPMCSVRVTPETLRLSLVNAGPDLAYESVPLPVPGHAALPVTGWTVQAVLDGAEEHSPGALCATLDADQIDLPTLIARNWRAGDFITPLGMGGRTKKLSDIFIDAKVPRGRRCHIPLVADKNGLLWVAGQTISERARVTEKTRGYLTFIAIPAPSVE